MHKANHPNTKHYCESVWDVDPIKACEGHPVALAWFSPDCKHFSKAKGGKPKDKTIRGLAWVALRWAALVRPRVIMLENVEEFQTWGPLNRGHRPVKRKKGTTFTKFVSQLQELGYRVEYRELVAADYGAPTMRKRFFLIARCDGKPIVWPQPTHAPAGSPEVLAGAKLPYVGACTQIDFSLPCPSIFDTSEEIKGKYGVRAVRPLAEKTMDRIFRGLIRFLLENPNPFIVQCNHGGERRTQDIRVPMPTITEKHGYGVVEPYLIPIGYGEAEGQKPRIHDIKEPLPTIVSSGKHYVCEPLIAPCMVQIGQTGFAADRSKDIRDPLTTIVSKNEHCLVEAKMAPYIMCNNEHNKGASAEDPLPTITTGNRNFIIAPTLIQYHSETSANEVRGQSVEDSLMTVDGSNRYGLVMSYLSKFYNNGLGQDIREPLGTVTAGAGGGHFAEVRAFLIKYYGRGVGQDIKAPLDTITSRDRFGLVTIAGVDYQIVDIGLRMLEPRELYGCQGFPEDYIIDHDSAGKTYSRSEQVKRCGNAVPPPFATALVRANLPELCVAKRTRNMRIAEEQSGQLKFA